MAEAGVHYLLHAQIKERLAINKAEYDKATVQLQEAIAMGDLSENSEYDAAKETMRRITSERDALQPYLSMPQIKASDSAGIFEEGCVMQIKIYCTTPEPVDPRSDAFAKLTRDKVPVFEGTVLLGGTLPMQELMTDSALSTDTPIGSFLLGKQSGNYSIKVPGGFSNVYVRKLKSTEFKMEDIKCVYRE